jgi:hypothetical protein
MISMAVVSRTPNGQWLAVRAAPRAFHGAERGKREMMGSDRSDGSFHRLGDIAARL